MTKKPSLGNFNPDKDKVFENSVVEKLLNHLENNLPARTLKLEDDEKEVLHHLHLLTAKPMLYVLNKKAGGKNLDEMNDVNGKT